MSESQTRGLRLTAVGKTFRQGRNPLQVLKDVSFEIKEGEMVALVGPSGAGKSTLLHIAGLLETPDSGEVVVNGQVASKLGDGDRTALRRDAIGFVYQYHHLLPEFSALENIVLPQLVAGKARRAATERGRELLNAVGLGERLQHRPAELSGGEQQRTAIVRALANRPSVLLADEPTGNLDPQTADSVFGILSKLVHEARVAALIATHNFELAKRMDRVLRVQDGTIVEGLAGEEQARPRDLESLGS